MLRRLVALENFPNFVPYCVSVRQHGSQIDAMQMHGECFSDLHPPGYSD